MTKGRIIYHGGKEIVEFPEIRTAKYNKDFYFGFYCTYFKEQAERWENDTIFNYIQGFIDGEISRAAFWELAKFKRPTHQISFHTARALATLNFLWGYEVNYDDK